MAKMKYWNGTTWEILDAKDADTVDGKHAAATLLTTEKNDLAGAINELFTSVSNGKNKLETAITDKGGTVSKEGSIATFNELDAGIRSIPQAKGNALPSDVLSGKTFSSENAGIEVTGTMPIRTGHVTAQSRSRSGTTLRFRPQPGYYDGSSGNSVQYSDSNFIASNIREGVSIFGLTGTLHEGVKMAQGTIRSEPDSKSRDGWAYVYYVRFNMSILGFRPAVIFFCEVGEKISYLRSGDEVQSLTNAIWYDKYVAYNRDNPSVLYNSMHYTYRSVRWFNVPYSTGIVEIPVRYGDWQLSWVAFSEYPPLNHIS